MRIHQNSLTYFLLKPSTAQIVLSFFGTIGYFIDVYLSRFYYHFDKEIEYDELGVELIVTLLACNATVIGNRFIAYHFDRKYITYRPIKLSNYVLKLLIQVAWGLIICNTIFSIESYITSIRFNIYDVLAVNIFTIPFALIYYSIENANLLIKQYRDQKINIEKIEKERLQSELQLLRAQFNPHFIFNALNTIYFQLDRNDKTSKNILPLFKHSIAYLTNWCNTELVPIEKELEYLKNYIEIQMIRKSESGTSNFVYTHDTLDYSISPFILQPFIENAFKYTSDINNIYLQLHIKHGHLSYTVKNSIESNLSINQTRDKGIGLQNLKKRLELVYPNRHFILTTKQKDCFVAEIQLKLSHLE